jgi:hypothetical protein
MVQLFVNLTGLGNSHCESPLYQLGCVVRVELAHKSITMVFNSSATSGKRSCYLLVGLSGENRLQNLYFTLSERLAGSDIIKKRVFQKFVRM